MNRCFILLLIPLLIPASAFGDDASYYNKAVSIISSGWNRSIILMDNLRAYHKPTNIRDAKPFTIKPLLEKLMKTVRKIDEKKEFEYIFKYALEKIVSKNLHFYVTEENLSGYGFQVFISKMDQKKEPVSDGRDVMSSIQNAEIFISAKFYALHKNNDAVLLSTLMHALSYYHYKTGMQLLTYSIDGRNVASTILAITTAANIQRMILERCFPDFDINSDKHTAFLLRSAKNNDLHAYAFIILGINLPQAYQIIKIANNISEEDQIQKYFEQTRIHCENSITQLVKNRSNDKNSWEYYTAIASARTWVTIVPWTTMLLCSRYGNRSNANTLNKTLLDMMESYQKLCKAYDSGDDDVFFNSRLRVQQLQYSSY